MQQDMILEAPDSSKQFAGFFAISGVDLKVRRGTIHALIGPNGAGKTTCFPAGVRRPDSTTAGTSRRRRQPTWRCSGWSLVPDLGKTPTFQVFLGRDVPRPKTLA